MSHIFIIQMKQITYLWMMMTIFHKYYASFLSPNNNEDVFAVTEYDS